MKPSIDFAFEGFRIIRERPLVILIWGLFMLIGMVLGYGSFIALEGKDLLALIGLFKDSGASPDPTAMFPLIFRMIPAFLLTFVIMGLMQVMLRCAIFRVSFGSRDTSFGGLRFGGDELRQIGVGIVYFLVYLGIDIGVSIATGLFGGIVGVILGAGSKEMAAIGPAIGMLIHYCFLIWFICRMSLYTVQTFDQKKFNLFGSWALTNGRFWALFLGYFVAGIMLIVVYLLCAVVFGTGFVVLGMNSHLPQVTDPASFFNAWQSFLPFFVLGGLAVWIILPLIMAITVGAPAAAYRQLVGTRTTAANVF